MLPLEWEYTEAVLEARRRAASGGLRERIAFDLEGRPPYSNRAIDPVRVLSRRRLLSQEQWIDQVYGVHVLDHPFRNSHARPASPQMLVPSEKSNRFWPM